MTAPFVTMAAGLLLTASGPPPLTEAVVVANSFPLPGSDYDTLRYADDDAIRFAALFEELGVKTTLLTIPDADTVSRWGKTTEHALRPTRAELVRVLDEIRERFEAAPDSHRELYFVFSGHGSVDSSTAYLHLLDDRFTRTDLFDRILRVIPADRIHIIIDSCHSYFLVNARGQRVAAETDTEALDRYPHVGLMLSTSDRREVQEWDGYRAGVFSYQVLGALRGAADVDGDGIVSYAEVHAYVMAANFDVTNPTARIRPYVRTPGLHGDTLLDLRGVSRVARTRVDSDFEGHFVVVDEERGRVLDANKPPDQKLDLVLPPDRPLYVQRGDAHFRVVTSTTGEHASLKAAPEMIASLTKGSPADEFRTNLFHTPLTLDFVRGLSSVSDRASTRVVLRTPPPWYEDSTTVVLLSAGTAALIAGGVFTGLFVDARATANTPYLQLSDESFDAFKARVEAKDRATVRAPLWQSLMIGGYSAAGALFAAAAFRYLLDLDDGSTVRVAAGPGGATIAGTF